MASKSRGTWAAPKTARASFANAVVPRDFDVIEVPFPERGEPRLVRPEPEPAAAG